MNLKKTLKDNWHYLKYSHLDSRLNMMNPMMTFSNASLNRGVDAVGGWVELARTTLGSATSTIDVSSLPDKRYYMILNNYAASIDSHLRFNGVSTTTYAQRRSDNGSESSNGSQNKMGINASASGTNARFTVGYVANFNTKEKLGQWWTITQQTAGAANFPNRTEAVGKHAQTTNPIDQMTVVNTGGNFPTGAELVVLGWDPADTHTTNFWEELASVDLGVAGDIIDSGTITAKKYLWFQVYAEGANTELQFRFNSDSGSNYTSRRSTNGGADSTFINQTQSKINATGGTSATTAFMNCFVVNNSANEKLCISHQIASETDGAGTAPIRAEGVTKWNNTSVSITSIQAFNNGTGDFGTGSKIRVWGSN